MKKDTLSINKYNLLIAFILGSVVLLIIFVWIWFGYKDAAIENQIMQLKYTK